MRIAVISDIHSNLEALNAVLEDIERQDVDKIYCLGDVVGYGPNPVECVDLIKEKSEIVIRGNHDHYVCLIDSDPETVCKRLNDFAFDALLYNYSVLTGKHFIYLKSLPFRKMIREFDISLAHGSYFHVTSWNYVHNAYIAKDQFDYFVTQLCFIGHTHCPYIYSDKDELLPMLFDDFILSDDERYLINVGSVGQPRDKNPRSCYVIFEINEKNKRWIHYRRVTYDYEKTEKAILKAGLPEYLAERLSCRW